MKIFPAIDIRGGNAVRLFQGDYSKEKVYSDDPRAVALKFKEAGADCLHIVDLDGALEGVPVNFSTIREVISVGGFFAEVGGGVRSLSRIESYLEAGAGRVILGSAAVEKFSLVLDAVRLFGDKIAVGVDALGGRVLGVVAKGADIDAARAKAYAAVKNIHWNGMQYRTDIGIKYRQG